MASTEQELEVTVTSAATTPCKTNLKTPTSAKRNRDVSFTEDEAKVEVYFIEDEHNFRKTPSQAKQKAQAGRWSNPLALSTGRKRIRVDEMEDIDKEKEEAEKKAQEKQAAAAQTAAKAAVAKAAAVLAADAVVKLDPATLTPEEIDSKFTEAAKESFMKLVKGCRNLKVNDMVADLKATGLFAAIKGKHGAVRKWFTSKPDVFGLSSDNFISMAGHNDEFRDTIVSTLKGAPKGMLKMHQLVSAVKAQVSETGFKKLIRGYPTFDVFLLAHSNHFMISKKGNFVTTKTVKK